MKRWGPVDILSAKENREVILKLARHMLGVAVGPVGTYFLVRDLQPATAKYREALAAVAAVIVLNLLIALYVVLAFLEPDDPHAPPQVVTRLGRWAEPRAD